MSIKGNATDPATRIEIARTTIADMLVRASRMVNTFEANGGRFPVIPVDTFRMDLMAVISALNGETRSEYLAIDDLAAGRIAEILHKAKGRTTTILPSRVIEKARQLYGAAARAGEQIEAEAVDDANTSVRTQLHRPIAAAAMMLGEMLAYLPRANDGGSDAG